MPQVWKSLPRHQVLITHSAVEYDLSINCNQILIRRVENGFDTATIVLGDTNAKNYVDKVNPDDTVIIKQSDASETLVEICDGVIRRVDPLLPPNLLKVECDGAGYGLAMSSCGQEYGTESKNPTLDTIKEIVEDNSNGIVDLWVNKVLGTGVDTGYSYTTQVETIAGSIKYLYFPYKSCDKILNDVCDVVQAIKGANAGPHWIVDVSDRVLIGTVGNHGAPASTFWSTWWRTNEAGSTLVEGEDFIQFQFQHLAKEHNYVLYHGKLRKPGDGDKWTSSITGWDDFAASCTITLDTDAGDYKVGSSALNIDYGADGGHARYPSGLAEAWNISAWGGQYNIPNLSFWIKTSSVYNAINLTFLVRLFTNWGPPTNSYDWTLSDLTVANKWFHYNLPIGPNAPTSPNIFVSPGWSATNNPDWADIDFLDFQVIDSAATGCVLHIDGLNFGGYILRGARQNAAYSATDPMKLKVITDHIAKDDAGLALDDSGTMARLAYAELLRGKTTPIVGSFTIPMANDLLPGQLVHLHAKKQISGAFRINDDFRVTRLVHSMTKKGGYITTVEVSDDVLNARPRAAPTQLNILLGAARPEFQDRQSTSIKMREIDVTQTILEVSY